MTIQVACGHLATLTTWGKNRTNGNAIMNSQVNFFQF